MVFINAPDDWATVLGALPTTTKWGGWPFTDLNLIGEYVELTAEQRDSLIAYLARLRADSHAQTEALERITKLTGYWVQVGQDAQRVAREALGSSPITALAAAAAAPKERDERSQSDYEAFGG